MSSTLTVPESLTVTNIISKVTLLTHTDVQGDFISVRYDTLSGTMPNTYGNYLAIWQNQNVIPWDEEPLYTASVPTDTQAGDYQFDKLDLTNNSYIIGYAVGPDSCDDTAWQGQKNSQICSTSYIPPIANKGEESNDFQTNMSITNVGSTSLAVKCQTPSGYMPAANKNWLGIWKNNAASHIVPPDYVTYATSNSNVHTAVFNNIKISRGTTYTIGYFQGGWDSEITKRKQKALSCTLTFTNA